jgi:hypothetical protein
MNVKGASSDGPTPEASGITNNRLVTPEHNSEHARIYLSSLAPSPVASAKDDPPAVAVTLTANERPRASLAAI